MESYVSSLAKSNKGDRRSDVVAQEKINSCIKQLHNVIDSFEEDKTEQRFDTLSYKGKYSFAITAPSKPKANTEIYATVGNDNLWIGTLTTEGILNIESSDMRSVDNFTTVSIGFTETKENEHWGTDPDDPPPRYDEWTGRVENYEERYEIKNVMYKKTGTRTYRYVQVADWYDWVNDEWLWDYTLTEYIEDSYTLEADYSNADIYIFQRYLKK